MPTPAVSYQVYTRDQTETDRHWNAIVGNSGTKSECGWCKDRFGLSWQITPRALVEAITGHDPAAASLAFGVARNYPFVDGNKRTAAVACETFIMLNHGTLEVDDADLCPAILALAEGNLAEKDFATLLRKHTRVSHGQQIQEPRTRPYRARRTRRDTAKR